MTRLLAVLVRIVGLCAALCGIALVAACACDFFGAISRIDYVSQVLAVLEGLIPQIERIHSIATPMGGVLHADWLLYGCVLVCLQWPCARTADSIILDEEEDYA